MQIFRLISDLWLKLQNIECIFLAQSLVGFFFFLGYTQGMRKFPGHGANLSHSSDKQCPIFNFEATRELVISIYSIF